MRHIATATGLAVANLNPNHSAKQRKHKDRDRYADAGRSAREAMDRFRVAEAKARAEGRKVPPSCARVMMALVEQITTWSRRNDAFPISTPACKRYPAGGVMESTGLSRNTVRKALSLLEGYGCITVMTPVNVKGQRTGPTVIAFPVVDHLPEEDAPEDMSPAEPGTPSVLRDRYPVSLDSPGTPSVWTDPLTRETYEKEVRASVQRNALPDRPPGGRPGGRPSPSLGGGPPKGNPHREVTGEESDAADRRIRDALERGLGVDPEDIRIRDAFRW
jgi:hypothetical protein